MFSAEFMVADDVPQDQASRPVKDGKKEHNFNLRNFHDNLFYQMTLKQYEGIFLD